MDRLTNLIFPMAGEGIRFKQNGIFTPKPLLKLSGKYFFQVSVEALVTGVRNMSLTFVVLEEHSRLFEMDKVILSTFPSARIVTLSRPTSGSAETSHLGIQAANLSEGSLVIADCDQWIKGKGIEEMFSALDHEKIDIGLPVFDSRSPSYSYIKRDSERKILEIVEKESVSSDAVSGCYGFRSVSLFNEIYESMDNWGKEKYMSDVVRCGIKRQLRVYSFDLEKHVPFGTPAEYKAALLNENLLEALDAR
jgi:bifunctional N-acetylglucosamine-1-phosphate-uridyltransferase/glucosamine-1-phosphate-acetyltransferase GlmU-like protein